MESLKDDVAWPVEACHPLKVLIVGAGITSLTTALALAQCGHYITIYEAAQSLTEIGAGLQIAPNASRVLGRLGVLKEIMEKANVLRGISQRRWEDDEEIGTSSLVPGVDKKYGAPLCVIHRADLQHILLSALSSPRLGVNIRFGSKVISLASFCPPSIQLETGELITGDVVICADGVKSSLLNHFLTPASQNGNKFDPLCPFKSSSELSLHSRNPESDSQKPLTGAVKQAERKESKKLRPIPTGDAAYRVLIPRSKIEGDPKAIALLDGNIGMRWMGPGGHIMAYPIRNNELYNMVLLHPQQSQPYQTKGKDNNDSWTRRGSKEEMLEWYANWNPTVRNFLSYVPDGEVVEWNLYSHPHLPTWIKGRCVIIGDAAHPMLPYVAQGAAQGIEDAGVLACVLAKINGVNQIESALEIFQWARKERAETIQDSAAKTRRVLHLPDGEEQRARDSRMRDVEVEKGIGKRKGGDDGAVQGKNPDLWADAGWQDYMWGVDVMRVVLAELEDVQIP